MLVQKVNAPAFGTEVVLVSYPTGADWWDPNDEGLCIIAAYQPKGAANLAASYVDLSGNGNNCGPGVAPGWNAVNGWIFTQASAQFLVTGVVPASGWSGLVQFTNASDPGNAVSQIFGRRTGGINLDRFGVGVFATGPIRFYLSGQQVNVATVLPLSANMGIAAQQGYFNGVAEGAPIAPWGPNGASDIYIGARNEGVARFFAEVQIQALAIYNCTLTGPQMLAVATAMAAL